jgi:hypothetical protein
LHAGLAPAERRSRGDREEIERRSTHLESYERLARSVAEFARAPECRRVGRRRRLGGRIGGERRVG